MKRARLLLAATLVTTASAAAVLAAQATQAPATQTPATQTPATRTTPVQAPPMQPILAGRKIVPPARGEVLVEYTTAVTKRDGPNVVTRLQVKNVGSAPISRLTFTETWYDKAGVIVTGNKGVINGLFQPGEIQALTISTPYDARMSGNRQGFSHANGTVKTTRVTKFDAPKPAAGDAAAAATKKPAAAAK
jgi:hypothetical protein